MSPALAHAAFRLNTSRSPLYKLPDKLLVLITAHLDWSSAVALCLSSKRFYASRLWKYAYISPSARHAVALASELACGLFEVSAKTGVNVSRAFHAIIRELREREKRARISDETSVAGAVNIWKEVKRFEGAVRWAESRARWVRERLSGIKSG